MIQPIYYTLFLLLSALEGIAAIVLLFWKPSMEKNATFLGLSFSRLLLGTLALVIVFILLYLALRSILAPFWYRNHLSQIHNALQKENHLLVSITAPAVFLVTSIFILILFNSPAAKDLGMLPNAFERIHSLYIWAMLVCLQWIFLVLLSCPQIYRQKHFVQWAVIAKISLLMLMLVLTVFNWAIVFFRMQFFAANRYWPWEFTHKAIGQRDLVFLPALVAALICAWFVARAQTRDIHKLLALICIGYFIQLSFAFMEGASFESIRTRYVNSGHKDYAIIASEMPPLLDSIRKYESRYANNIFLSTKPPGVISLYILAAKLTNLIQAENTPQDRFYHLTVFMAYIFPALSLLTLIPLSQLSKKIWDRSNAFLPSAIYIVLPPVILFYLELDQFLHPLLLMSTLLLFFRTLETHAFHWAFMTGIAIYLALFFSFSMIFTPAVISIWYGIDFLQNIRHNPTHHIKTALGLITGFLVTTLLFYFLLNYDPLLRYQHSIASHKYLKDFETGYQQILDAILLNNGEFIHWAGIPIILLFLSRCAQSVFALVKGKGESLDAFCMAFMFAFVLLNIFGQTRGEVARLWIFLLPPITLFSAVESRSLFGKNTMLGIYLIVALQLLSTWIMFKYQDPFIPFY
ncbi:MAG: hypothetical protein HPY45_03315 [Anaerolineae bacterium]|nr:hypothetical protein [Anaerolineae bacterium]